MTDHRLTVEVAELFLKDRFAVDLTEFTRIDDEAAKLLAESKHTLGLDLRGLVEISDTTARILATHIGEMDDVGSVLYLDGLTHISEPAAVALSHHFGSLSLGGLTELSTTAAVALSKHRGDLSLNGLTSLSCEAAEALSQHNMGHRYAKPHLDLNGLTELPANVARALIKHEGCLNLRGIATLSDAAARVVSERKEGINYDTLVFQAIERVQTGDPITPPLDASWIVSYSGHHSLCPFCRGELTTPTGSLPMAPVWNGSSKCRHCKAWLKWVFHVPCAPSLADKVLRRLREAADIEDVARRLQQGGQIYQEPWTLSEVLEHIRDYPRCPACGEALEQEWSTGNACKQCGTVLHSVSNVPCEACLEDDIRTVLDNERDWEWHLRIEGERFRFKTADRVSALLFCAGPALCVSSYLFFMAAYALSFGGWTGAILGLLLGTSISVFIGVILYECVFVSELEQESKSRLLRGVYLNWRNRIRSIERVLNRSV